MVENTKHLFNQNCLATMASLPDNHVDLVITSPPYNMNLRIRNGKYCSRQVTRDEFSTKYNGFDDNLPIEEFYHQHKTILNELLRISPLIFYNISIVTGSRERSSNSSETLMKNLKILSFGIRDMGNRQCTLVF